LNKLRNKEERKRKKKKKKKKKKKNNKKIKTRTDHQTNTPKQPSPTNETPIERIFHVDRKDSKAQRGQKSGRMSSEEMILKKEWSWGAGEKKKSQRGREKKKQRNLD